MRTTVLIIGAGQAGLAVSHCLTGRSVDHVVLERGDVANSWRAERWDSLRLLTPNWLTRLPGHRYGGPDPDGFLTAAEVVGFLEQYRAAFRPPVITGTTVTSVRRSGPGFVVETDQGRWLARAVVVASGAFSHPHVPSLAAALPAHLTQLTALRYRAPAQLGGGGVLVVGASASGVQIADELRRHGREVTLAVGDHVRVPRRYRGRDIHGWLDELGDLRQRYDEVEDLARARRLPSLQAAGTAQGRTLDLNALRASGVGLTGRLVGVAGSRLQFSGALPHLLAAADLKQARLLDRVDALIAARGWADRYPQQERPEPTAVPPPCIAVEAARFGTVLWATGYRPQYPWLDPALLDRAGRVVHDGGVGAVPGLYVLGLPFTRTRSSSFLGGVGPDAAHLAEHIDGYLRRPARAA